MFDLALTLPDTTELMRPEDRAAIVADSFHDWAVMVPVQAEPVTTQLPDHQIDFLHGLAGQMIGAHDRVDPIACLGRVILVNVTPVSRHDPPICLLLQQPAQLRRALTKYYEAMRAYLNGSAPAAATLLQQAIPQLIADSIGALTRAELAYLITKAYAVLANCQRTIAYDATRW